MTTEATGRRDLLPVIVARVVAQLPDGYDSWGIKSVRPDLMTDYGFRWAMPGGTSSSDHRLNRGNSGACPEEPGDGLCVATTWRGMASGGIPAITLLLVAYRSVDVVGRDDIAGKLRLRGDVAVVRLMDGARLVRESGCEADLRGADLSGADLDGANLREAVGADLPNGWRLGVDGRVRRAGTQ